MKRYAIGIALLILGGALVAFWLYLVSLTPPDGLMSYIKGTGGDRPFLELGAGFPLVTGLFTAINGARILISRNDGQD